MLNGRIQTFPERASFATSINSTVNWAGEGFGRCYANFPYPRWSSAPDPVHAPAKDRHVTNCQSPNIPALSTDAGQRGMRFRQTVTGVITSGIYDARQICDSGIQKKAISTSHGNTQRFKPVTGKPYRSCKTYRRRGSEYTPTFDSSSSAFGPSSLNPPDRG